jgi:hypothetical protein
MRSVGRGRHDDPHAEEAASAAVSKHARRPSEAGPNFTSRPKVLSTSLPLLTAVLAVLLVWATGFTERSLIGTALEDHFYGYFFRSYPVLLFAMVYGAARIVAAAVTEPRGRAWLRALATPLALALFLIAGFHPTFGGVIARPGFAAGGMSFLQGQPAGTALLVGAVAAASVYAAALGAAVILARLRITLSRRALLPAIARGLALSLGAVILLQAQNWALDRPAWPVRALGAAEALGLAAGVALAFLPHALALAWTGRRMPPQGRPNSLAKP